MENTHPYPDCNILNPVRDSHYRGATGLSQSSLKLFLTSPAHYFASLEAIVEPTKAMQFGTACHAMVLQENPKEHYAVKKKVDGRSKEGRAYNEEFQLENQGKVIIDEEDEERIRGMMVALHKHPTASKLLATLTHKEFAVFANYPVPNGNNVRIKGLIDGYSEKTGIIVDYKTADDASPRGFRKAIWDRRYDIQQAHYTWLMNQTGLPVIDFVFIAQEKVVPYAVGCYTINLESIKNSNETWEKALARFSECQSSGMYPAYSENIEQIIL